MSVPVLLLILVSLLCAGLFTRTGHTHSPLRSALTVLFLAGTVPAMAEPQVVSNCTDLYFAFNEGGDYILADDFDPRCSTYLSVPYDTIVTLDLNGQTLDRGLKDKDPVAADSVIYVSGKLTLTGSGTITGGSTTADGGGIYIGESGTFTMGEGVTITGNKANDGGGVANYGTFNMDGGTITDNTAKRYGGGVYNYGTFNMDGGEISRNTAARDGGGVYNVYSYTFNLSGGTITNNTANWGGGVNNNGTFNLSGGTISENTAIADDNLPGQGGGISVMYYSQIIISGDPVITGNTADGKTENVYLRNNGNLIITVGGELSKNASIGISVHNINDPDEPIIPGVFTSGLPGKGEASVFSSDDPDYYVDTDTKTGEATLTEKSGETAITPDISPAGGKYTGPVDVTITSGTEGASIYYTTDKTDPTAESALYTGTFTVTVSGTVKAIAVRNDLYDSGIASETYTIEDPVYALSVAAPTFDPVTYGYEQPEAQPVIIENSGNTDAAVTVSIENTKITKDGEEAPAAFILNTTAGTTVAAGTADTGTYTVQPAADLGAGTYSADLTVAYSDTFTYASLSFTVNKDQQTLEVTQEGAAAGETLPDPQYQAPEGTVSLSYSGDGYGPSPDAPKSAGTYTVTVTVETDNVIYTGSAAFTITPSDEPGPDPEPQPEPRRRLFRMCEDCELPATGFSAVRPTALRSQPAALRYEPVRMRLMLPTLDEDIELVTLPREGNTWAADWLGENAGILEGSGIPGRGTAVIAAHNTLNDTQYGPFAMLATMEKGDRIFVTDGDGELLSFEVYANELLTPDGMGTIEAMAEENALVLITCENEAIEGGYLNRRAVFAK